MRRFTPILILLACLALRPAAPAAAGLFDALTGDDTLVTLDGTRYTTEDFKRWWKFWQEDDQPLPKTPDPYIDWLLLAREGKKMQLDEDPAFKRQTRIFLQSRTLLILKYDAVDSRIKISDAEVRARYEKEDLPRWLVQRWQFTDEATAKAAWEGLSNGTMTVEELLALDPGKGGPLNVREDWLRPRGIDPGWADLFRKMVAGKVVDPSEHKGGANLYYLKEQKGADEEDFARLREDIRKDIWKEREDALTRAMLEELRKKYKVKVDQERLDALDLNASDDSLTDAVVISSTQKEVTERQFMAVIRKLMATRSEAGHASADEEKARKLKNDTAANIIAQEVTNWESLDRGYETKPPFKWEYEFNYNHRLVLALEQQLFLPATQVTEDEIKKYYDEHIDRFTQPTLVKVQIIDDTLGPVDQVWADVMVGKDFQKAVREHFEMNVETREAPINHLDPDVKAAVEKLAVGETSPIFNAQGSRVIVHLVDRTPTAPIPLKSAAETVRSMVVREKMNQASDAYLEKIKALSKIDVRKRQWEAIQKELGGA